MFSAAALRRSAAHAILGGLLLLVVLTAGLVVSEWLRGRQRPEWTLLPPSATNVLSYKPDWTGFESDSWELSSYRDEWDRSEYAEYFVDAVDCVDPPFLFCRIAVPRPTSQELKRASEEWQAVRARVRAAMESSPGLQRRATRGELTEADLQALGF